MVRVLMLRRLFLQQRGFFTPPGLSDQSFTSGFGIARLLARTRERSPLAARTDGSRDT